MKSVLVGYLLFLSSTVFALVPVEGILLGEAVNEYQQDPLNFIFSDIYDKSIAGENTKLRLYQSTIESGKFLKESCQLFVPPTYASSWMEKQAKRSMVSTIQYIGLDTSIKAIGVYAKKMELSEEAFQKLSSNLVKNYCSKNITVFSIKRLEQALNHYYKNPQANIMPTVEGSPFMTSIYKTKTESIQGRSNEFDQAISNFKAFCSWGGDVVDYRLMVPYLNNSFIMAFMIKNMTGVQDKYDDVSQKVSQVPSSDTVQVGCTDLICRKVNLEQFKQNFPRSVGSTGLYTDLAKLYCHHFKVQDYSGANSIPLVREWIKKMELEDPIFETSFFISLMTGVPDAIFGVESYSELPLVAKSSIDERWKNWANETLKSFSKDMLFEESLKIKAQPRRDRVALRTQGFLLDFSVTLGEMDRIVDDNDKLALTFDIKLSKNYIRHMRAKWIDLTNNVDEEGRIKFRDEMSKFISFQLKEKEKYFRQKMWNEDFSRLIVQELVEQVLAYRGPMFDSYQEEMFKIPVRFSYGVFALGYLRYRADVKAGRLKLNL
ncbi:MAG: hypothetical protein H0V66_05300 [Bdellovibrionales bacterium]|nr:hypothetical protein [Bdellovibrionales bacterium]